MRIDSRSPQASEAANKSSSQPGRQKSFQKPNSASWGGDQAASRPVGTDSTHSQARNKRPGLQDPGDDQPHCISLKQKMSALSEMKQAMRRGRPEPEPVYTSGRMKQATHGKRKFQAFQKSMPERLRPATTSFIHATDRAASLLRSGELDGLTSSGYHLLRAANRENTYSKTIKGHQREDLFYNSVLGQLDRNNYSFFKPWSFAHQCAELGYIKSVLAKLNKADKRVTVLEAMQTRLIGLRELSLAFTKNPNLGHQAALIHSKVMKQDHTALSVDAYGEKSGHAMVMVFDRISDEGNLYNVSVINRGAGARKNHISYRKAFSGKSEKIAATRVFPKVCITNDEGGALTEKKLGSLLQTAFERKGNMDDKLDVFYQTLDDHAHYDRGQNWQEYNRQLLEDPQLRGKYVQATQKDGNCTYSSLRGYLRVTSATKDDFSRADALLAKERLDSAREYLQVLERADPGTNGSEEEYNDTIDLFRDEVLPSLKLKLAQANARVSNLATQP